jgi:hypothetical protein
MSSSTNPPLNEKTTITFGWAFISFAAAGQVSTKDPTTEFYTNISNFVVVLILSSPGKEPGKERRCHHLS